MEADKEETVDPGNGIDSVVVSKYRTNQLLKEGETELKGNLFMGDCCKMFEVGCIKWIL